MIWYTRSARRRKHAKARYDWWLVFAWWPVKLEGERVVWLQRYYRRWIDFEYHPGGSFQRVLPGEDGTPRLPFMDRSNNDPPGCGMPLPPAVSPTAQSKSHRGT